MPHPEEFATNEAWLVFKLNDLPIMTEEDGNFDCVCVMDAAGLDIIANTLVPAEQRGLTELEARRLIKMAQAKADSRPQQLLLPEGEFGEFMQAEGHKLNAEVKMLASAELNPFVTTAREGFLNFQQAGPGAI